MYMDVYNPYFSSPYKNSIYAGYSCYASGLCYPVCFSGTVSQNCVAAKRSPEPIPRKLLLNISDQCCFQCKMCAFRPGRQNKLMTLSDWKRLVTETCEAGVHYTLFGGEPLLWEDIDELICHIRRCGASMELVTNGFYLKKHIETIVNNQCRLIISIDGLREVHDQIRNCTGSFQKIEDSLKILGRDYPAFLREMVCVNSVLLPENLENARGLIDYLYQNGIRTVSFQQLQYYDEKEQRATDQIWQDSINEGFHTILRPREEFLFSPEMISRIQTAASDIYAYRQTYPEMSVCIFPELSREEIASYYSDKHECLAYKSACLMPWYAASVSLDGNISLCLDASIGNYLEHGFWNAWYGEKARRFRDFVFWGSFPVCTRCCNFYNSYV